MRIGNDRCEAIFDGSSGLRLVSLNFDGFEAVVRALAPPLIGPHVGSRIPELFEGEDDPAPNGAASRAVWTFEEQDDRLRATFAAGPESAEAALEKQPFHLRVDARWEQETFCLTLNHTSETDSAIGFPIALNLDGVVEARVEEGEERDSQGWIRLPLDSAEQRLYAPYPSKLGGEIKIEGADATLVVQYSARCEEVSWQLENGPILTLFTASNPKRPVLSSNLVELRLSALQR